MCVQLCIFAVPLVYLMKALVVIRLQELMQTHTTGTDANHSTGNDRFT